MCYMHVYLLSCPFKSMFSNYVTKPRCCLTLLVLIVQLIDRNSMKNKNIARKIEFRETNFCDGINFNKFCRIQFRNLGPILRKQISRILVLLKNLLAQNSINKIILKQEKLMAYVIINISSNNPLKRLRHRCFPETFPKFSGQPF